MGKKIGGEILRKKIGGEILGKKTKEKFRKENQIPGQNSKKNEIKNLE